MARKTLIQTGIFLFFLYNQRLIEPIKTGPVIAKGMTNGVITLR